MLLNPCDTSCISEQAAFYEAHGFVRLPESLRLALPMRAIEKLLTP